MTDYSAGGIEPQLGKRANSGWVSLAPSLNAGRAWNFIPLAPGVFGSFFAGSLYPLLDGRYWLIGVVFGFFVLTGVVPRAAVFSGLALALLAATLLLNGALDKYPSTYVRTTVIRKSMVTGSAGRGTHYDVIVSSWRPGRIQEDFEVDSGVFNRTTAGNTVTVELRKGFFGIPWYGNISAE
jgi:hypothetical protein